MKKIFTLILLSLMFFGAKSQSTVVISQIYGGGGNTGATYTNDFIELFNRSASAVDIAGWSIQYANASSASGNWTVTTLTPTSPATTIIVNPGQYFLVKLGSGGANGAALPTADFTGTTNMGTTDGRVALLSNNTQLTAGQCPTGNTALKDLVGYGTAATCFEGSAPTAKPSATNAAYRASNGCTDTDNNGSDFALAAVNPRNSASPTNSCGPAVATLFASPNISNLSTPFGVASAAQSFNLSGTTLTGAPGNITVTPSAGLEVSLSSGGTYSTSPISVPYASATLAATPVFVRIVAGTAVGAVTGTVTCSGGGAASNAVVNVTGNVYQNYYNTKANLGLNVVGTWSSTPDGSGGSPANFTAAYQYFNIINQTNANYTGVWDVTGTGSKVIVGDGTSVITFTVKADADSVTSATRIDVTNNATLVIQNNRRPFLNTLYNGSTVDFAQTGITVADTIRIPAITYFNLKLTGGLKYFSGNTTTINGNLVADGVVSMNGNGVSPFSTLNCFGNITLTNNAMFEPTPAGDAGRITLKMNAPGTQTITGSNALNPIYLFRLQRDTTSSSSVIVLGGTTTTLALGNPSGGGLSLNQGAATTTILNIGSNYVGIGLGGVVTTSSLGKITATLGTIAIGKTTGAANAGTLRFTSGSTLAQLLIQCDVAFTRDTIFIADNIDVATLTLTKGRIVVNPGIVLNVVAGGTVTGGSATAYVDGKLARTSTGTGAVSFPLGQGGKYAPLTMSYPLGQAIAQYFYSGYGNYTIDPATLGTYPGYHVSAQEYWRVDPGTSFTSPATMVFYYTDVNSIITDPLNVYVAHNDLTDWNDLGGTPDGANTTTSGFVTVSNVTTFSPFTFAARVAGVVPVKLEYIKAKKATAGIAINWKVSCLSTSISMELQRSADTRNFNSITTINASQARCGLPFDYTDIQPLNGKNFYRLKMTDADGKVSYSPVVAVLNGITGVTIAGLYPTVVTSETSLSIAADKSTTLETMITDINGKLIRTSRQLINDGSNLVKVDCSSLPAGVYNLTALAAGESKTIRFVKQ